MAAKDAFTADEKAAMKERAREAKANATKEKAEANLLEKIGELTGIDRAIADRLNEIVKEHAPGLDAKTHYGMPGWAKDGKVIVFYQPGEKFKTRYGTVGVQDNAEIDEGASWATSWAIAELTPAVDEQLVALVKKLA